MRRVTEPLRATSHTFVFAMLPMILVLTSYGGPFPANLETVRSLAVIAGLVVGVLVLLRPLGGSLAARAATTSAAVIVLSGYRTVFELLAPAHASRMIEQPVVAGLFAVGAALVGIAVRRPWDPSPRRTPFLSTLALLMLALGTVPTAWPVLGASSDTWRTDADRIVEGALVRGRPATPERDVYVIVLDGLGRGDVLKRMYGVDVAAIQSYLRASGFYVADRARAPYSQTELSIPALLNMSHLDRVAASAGSDNADRSPTEYLLARNAMMASARRAGYDVVSIASEFAPTRAFRDARELAGPPDGLSELQQEAMKMTPLAALPLNRWTNEAHREHVLEQFNVLEQLRPAHTGPHRLVFTHVLAPHPPFVFNADGSPRALDTNWLEMGDGNWFDGSRAEYVEGYSAQARFVLARLEQALTAILRQPGPTPAILITGDHGPGSELHWDNAAGTNMTERMGVFSAYRFPGVSPDRFYPTMSPVNAARILANTYFGTNLPPLPDESAFSTWGRPYDFIKLPPEVEK